MHYLCILLWRGLFSSVLSTYSFESSWFYSVFMPQHILLTVPRLSASLLLITLSLVLCFQTVCILFLIQVLFCSGHSLFQHGMWLSSANLRYVNSSQLMLIPSFQLITILRQAVKSFGEMVSLCLISFLVGTLISCDYPSILLVPSEFIFPKKFDILCFDTLHLYKLQYIHLSTMMVSKDFS